MAGAEPIQDALDDGADVVLLGRCADAAIFAAMPLARVRSRPGGTRRRSWSADRPSPRTVGARTRSSARSKMTASCSSRSTRRRLHAGERRGAHALRDRGSVSPDDAVGHARRAVATYEALDDRRVKVRGGTFAAADAYTAKLEGAAPVGFLSTFWGSMRDAVILSQLPAWRESLEEAVRRRLDHVGRSLPVRPQGLRRQRHRRRDHRGGAS